MHALVIGAGGFLGRYIVEQLRAEGHSVRGFSRRRYPEVERLGVDWIEGDLRNPAAVRGACEGIDTVFHTAAVAGIWGPWKHYYGINTLGTRHVLAACREQGVARLVYSSSPSVTFAGQDQLGVDETAPYPTRWLCHYPHTKALAEREVLDSDSPDGLRSCALRPHLIWGPRDAHLIPRLLERARSGQLRIVGDGRNLVDMVYVENAARAHLLAADALGPPGGARGPACGNAYFISQDAPVNCWEWINQILALANLPPLTRRVPFPVAWYAGGTLELLYRITGRQDEPRMTRFLAAQLAKAHYFDTSAAKRDLKYVPEVSTDEGMQRLAHWIAQTNG